MDNNLNRLECKLKEIILDSRQAHTSDYSKSVREDHLHGSVLGKNAYTLDDSTAGTTIFMPWKLHRPIEDVFNKLSEYSLMSRSSFKTFVDNFGLFPKFQNTRKKEDIIDYILNKSNPSSGPLNFEQFLLALFLLSKYRSSVLHTNEQFAFNVLLNSIISNSHNLYKEDVEPNFNLNLVKDESKNQNVSSRTSSKNLDGVIYHDTGLIVDTNIGKVYESPRKLETKDFSDTVESIREEETKELLKRLSGEPKLGSSNFVANSDLVNSGQSQVNNSGSFDPDLVKKLLDVLRDQNLLSDTKLFQDSLEREINLRNEMETNYMDKFSKLEAEKNELNKEFTTQKGEFKNLQDEHSTLCHMFEDYKNTIEEKLKSLASENQQLVDELDKANKKLERQKFLKSRFHKAQQLLVLETDFELKLFAIFCIYKDEECVEGEFVLSEERLISFCVDFGLTESEPPSSPDDAPKAKHAYNKVHEFSYDGKLNYGLFKEFLMNLGQLLKPNLDPQEAFRYVVFQLVSYSSNNLYGNYTVDDYHPLYVTESNNPWENDSIKYENKRDLRHNTSPNRFLNVEGEVWFDKKEENKKVTKDEAVLTPRFD